MDGLPSSTSATFISTSAVGYYGFTGDETLDEGAPKGNGFLADLAADWESEALKAQKKGARVVLTRFGVVLGKDGGALAQMITPFRFFVGGPIGNGRQWFSWIHIQDLCRSSLFVIEDSAVKGAVNFTAPGAVQNRDLAKAVGTHAGAAFFHAGAGVYDKPGPGRIRFSYPERSKSLSGGPEAAGIHL